MRNVLLFLTVSLILVYLAGGPGAVVEALVRLFVLGGVQVITHYLNQANRPPKRLKQADPHRLKKIVRKDLSDGPR